MELSRYISKIFIILSVRGVTTGLFVLTIVVTRDIASDFSDV